MDDQLKLAYESARGLSELLITLSTAIIGVTITFAKEFDRQDNTALSFLRAAWVFYLLAIAFGILTRMALTGHLASTRPFGLHPVPKTPS
jgi:hypothetical protein